jgi:hypothetical protein
MANRLNEVLKVIVRHCDEQNKTKNIHKILYLSIKYILLRVNCQKQKNSKRSKKYNYPN